MLIIDAQVHCYEADAPPQPGVPHIPGPAAPTGENQIAAMDDLGLDAALLVSPWGIYGYDTTYAVKVYTDHPTRFRIVAPIDPYDPAAADRVAAWAEVPGAVGIRIIATFLDRFDAADPEVARTIQTAAGAGMAVCVLCSGKVQIMDDIARLYPDAQLVLDHLGLEQPMRPPRLEHPFADLDSVLALATHPNVAIKVTGACTLSHEPYPFEDIWAPLGRVFDAFGMDRCMWGTDWTRAIELVNYHDAVAAFRDSPRLSAADRSALMGETLQRVFNWEKT
jgi:predicted TIM-barrel fold metal-dependent hydrolase